jgi:hypothetical protein
LPRGAQPQVRRTPADAPVETDLIGDGLTFDLRGLLIEYHGSKRRNDMAHSLLKTRSERDPRLAEDLMAGERTQDVSSKFGLSPARVSQLRRDFHDDWQRFCGLDKAAGEPHREGPAAS